VVGRRDNPCRSLRSYESTRPLRIRHPRCRNFEKSSIACRICTQEWNICDLHCSGMCVFSCKVRLVVNAIKRTLVFSQLHSSEGFQLRGNFS